MSAELSLLYAVPLTEKVTWESTVGLRRSRRSDPWPTSTRPRRRNFPWRHFSHHLQDSTHTSFGVITTGFGIDRIKLASAFNGRQPNERWSIQFAALDSWSAHASVAPSRNWTTQYSIGRLEHPEAFDSDSQWRQTASAEYNRRLARGDWATSLIWGRVHRIAAGTNLNGCLLESTLNFRERNYAFTRLESVDKDELFPAAPVLRLTGSERTPWAESATSGMNTPGNLA